MDPVFLPASRNCPGPIVDKLNAHGVRQAMPRRPRGQEQSSRAWSGDPRYATTPVAAWECARWWQANCGYVGQARRGPNISID